MSTISAGPQHIHYFSQWWSRHHKIHILWIFFSALIKFTFCDLFFTLSRCRPLTSERLNPASLFVPCKVIQDSPELWIASCGFRIPGTGFQFLLACVAWQFCRARCTSGEAARITKTSWFLCPRPPLLLGAPNQNRMLHRLSFCHWNLDSGFQSFVVFRIPWAVFQIPILLIPDSTYKNSPESEFPYMPGRHWPLAKPTDKHQYLPHLSGHPIHTKRAIPLNLYRICWTNKTASHSAQKNYLAISKNVSGLQPLFRPSTS